MPYEEGTRTIDTATLYADGASTNVDASSAPRAQPSAKLGQHDQAVRDTLLQRGKIYAAGGDDHITGSIAGILAASADVYLQHLEPAQRFYISKILEKAARAITGGLGGVYHGDNGLDLSGYEALLAAASSGRDLYDVLESAV